MTTIYDKAKVIAGAVDHVMVDELKLQAPTKYQLVKDGNFILMLAVMDAQNLRGSIHKYITENVLHQLSTAVGGLPVVLSNHSGLRYAVSLTGRPRLPKVAPFPGHGRVMPLHDGFGLGVSLRGEVNLHPAKMVNMLIAGSQESGKSMVLRLIAHATRMQGAKLYLVDPVAHTFNPDVWNDLAEQPVAGTRSELITILERLQVEVETRTVLFRKAALKGLPPEDLNAYNLIADPLPRIYLFGDEMNTFLGDRIVQDRIADLARVGRKWGVHVILAGHNWRSEDIPRGLSAMFPTRLCLHVADDTSGNVTLNSPKWGKQALKFRNPGRAILLAHGKYQKVQLYYVSPEQEREWLSDASTATSSPLSVDETTIVMRAINEADGKMTGELLMGWGLSDTQARNLAERYESRGWLEKDPKRGNARFLTPKLKDLLPNQQTAQTAPKPSQSPQSGQQTQQTASFAGA